MNTNTTILSTNDLKFIPVNCQEKAFENFKKYLFKNNVQHTGASHQSKGNGTFKIDLKSNKDSKTVGKILDQLVLRPDWFIESVEHFPARKQHYFIVTLSLEKFKVIRLNLGKDKKVEVSNAEPTQHSPSIPSITSVESSNDKEEVFTPVAPDDYTYEDEFNAFKGLLRKLGFTSKHISNFAPASKNGPFKRKRLSCRNVLVTDLLCDVLVSFPNFWIVDLPKTKGNVNATGVIIDLKFGCIFSDSVDHATFFDEKILNQFKDVGIDITKIKMSARAYKMITPKIAGNTVQKISTAKDSVTKQSTKELSKSIDKTASVSAIVAGQVAMARALFHAMLEEAKTSFIFDIIEDSNDFVSIKNLKDLGYIKAEEFIKGSGLVRPEEYIVELAEKGFKSKDAFEKELKDAISKNKEALLKEIKEKGLVIVNPEDLFDKSGSGFNLKEVKI